MRRLIAYFRMSNMRFTAIIIYFAVAQRNDEKIHFRLIEKINDQLKNHQEINNRELKTSRFIYLTSLNYSRL